VTDQTANQTSAVVAAPNPQVVAFQRVRQALEARSDALMAVLPDKVGVDRFMRVCLGAMSRQPKLFDCTTESLVKAMLDAAELGLEPSGLMGQAYLVPHRNTRAGTNEATLIIGYRGLAELARRSGQVYSVEARVVRQRDVFAVEYGTASSIHHVPYLPGLMGAPAPGAPDAPADGPGPFMAAYAVLTLHDGSRVVDVMTTAEVDAIRRRSRSGDQGPWVTDYLEMARKTVLRRALKYAPVSIVDVRVAEALDTEDRAQYGHQEPMAAAIAEGSRPASVTAARAAFVQGASGQDDAHQPIPVVPGQVPAFEDDLGPIQEDSAAPGPSDAPTEAPGGFTASPAIGVKVSGKATGKRGPARTQAESDADLPPGSLPADPPADPTTGEVVGAATAAMGDLVACDYPSPYGDGARCLKAKGHRSAHGDEKATW
jgi:recombination protein RecT